MGDRVRALHQIAAARPGVIGLSGGLPADALFPRAQLAAVMLDVISDREALQYGWPEGVALLRRWIADRLARRGAVIDPERVIVTAGAQQALALIATTFPSGTPVAVGSETYPGALAAFDRAGLHAIAGDHADARYVIVGVSNPCGIDRIEPSRAAVLAAGGQLIVDEAYAELRFDGRIARPLLADAPDDVWHVGTVSKTVSPGLRIGWLIAPVRAHDQLLEFKHAADLHTGSLAQVALVRLLVGIDYDALLDRARAHYALRAARLSEALHDHASGLRFAEPEGGFSIWVHTDEPGDDIALLEDALAAGVSVDPGHMFRPGRGANPVALRLSFSSAPIEQFVEGARRLASALQTWRRRNRRRAA